MSEIPGGATRAGAMGRGEAGEAATAPDPAFQRGMESGREWVQQAAVKVASWAEENPGQMVLAAVGVGIVIGKLFFSPSRRRDPDLDFDD